MLLLLLLLIFIFPLFFLIFVRWSLHEIRVLAERENKNTRVSCYIDRAQRYVSRVRRDTIPLLASVRESNKNERLKIFRNPLWTASLEEGGKNSLALFTWPGFKGKREEKKRKGKKKRNRFLFPEQTRRQTRSMSHGVVKQFAEAMVNNGRSRGWTSKVRRWLEEMRAWEKAPAILFINP